MAYLPHCQVIIKGVLGTSALTPFETWQTGHQISDTNFADLPSQAQVDAISSDWGTAVHASSMNLSDAVIYTGLQVVAIAADGKWRKNPDGSYMQRSSTSGAPFTGAVAEYRDFPVSSVASLFTTRAGAHGRGRMYWPLPVEPVFADGHVSDAACANRALAVATTMTAINTILASGSYLGEVVVASRAGYLSKVTNVRVGNVHDTQRRRRNGLSETYSVHAV